MSDERVLAIAAHPDDEILGCGGTLARHADGGAEVTVVIASGGRYEDPLADGLDPEAALREVGVADLRLLGLPDQQFDTLPLTEIIAPIEAVVTEVRPTIVYSQHGGDINHDHQALFRAVLVATRPTEPFISAVYAFDTASSTEWAFPRAFVPDTWVDISVTLERKLAAMMHYSSELREYPHPRSIEGLRHRAEAWG